MGSRTQDTEGGRRRLDWFLFLTLLTYGWCIWLGRRPAAIRKAYTPEWYVKPVPEPEDKASLGFKVCVAIVMLMAIIIIGGPITLMALDAEMNGKDFASYSLATDVAANDLVQAK